MAIDVMKSEVEEETLKTSKETLALVISRSTLVREGLQAVLSVLTNFKVVGITIQKSSGVDWVLGFEPDLIVLDYSISHPDTVKMIGDLCQLKPPVKVLVLVETPQQIDEILQAGAHHVLVKGAPTGELFRTINMLTETLSEN